MNIVYILLLLLFSLSFFLLMRVWAIQIEKNKLKNKLQNDQKDFLLEKLLVNDQLLRHYFAFSAQFDKQHYTRCFSAYKKHINKKEINDSYKLKKAKKWTATKLK